MSFTKKQYEELLQTSLYMGVDTMKTDTERYNTVEQELKNLELHRAEEYENLTDNSWEELLYSVYEYISEVYPLEV